MLFGNAITTIILKIYENFYSLTNNDGLIKDKVELNEKKDATTALKFNK